MTETSLATDGRLRGSLVLFGLAYLVMSALVTAVLVIFNIDAPGGVAIGVLVAAIAVGARKFVVDNRRALRRGEQLRFALLALGVILLISLLQLIVLVPIVIGVAALPAATAEVQAGIAENTTVLVLVIAAVVLIYFAVLYFTSGWFSRSFSKRLTATGRI
jgi:cytochrome bd-type quinol oxidase subunit 2